MKYLHFFKNLATSALILVLVVACTGDTGSEGNLKFQDKSGVSSNQVLPVAQGRTVNYTITNTAFSPKKQDVEDAESSDEAVFRVKTVSGSSVSIEGVGEGNATLNVTTEKGVRDRLSVEVRAPQTTYYRIATLNGDEVPQGIIDVGGKYNVNPADELTFGDHILVDKDGQRLSGEESSELEEGSDGTTSVASRSVKAGAAGEEVTVDNAYGGTMSVRVVEDYVPASIIGFGHVFVLGDLDAALLSVQNGTTLSVDDSAYNLRVYPKDADGYAYIGATDLNAGVKLRTPDVVELSYIGRTAEGAGDVCVDRTDDDKCIEWGRLQDIAFMVTVKDENATSVDLEITTGVVTETITLNL